MVFKEPQKTAFSYHSEGVKKTSLKYFVSNKILPNFERFLSNHLIDHINELLLIF